MSDRDRRFCSPNAAASQLAQSWWYRFYFSPPALSAGSRGVGET